GRRPLRRREGQTGGRSSGFRGCRASESSWDCSGKSLLQEVDHVGSELGGIVGPITVSFPVGLDIASVLAAPVADRFVRPIRESKPSLARPLRYCLPRLVPMDGDLVPVGAAEEQPANS